MHIDLISEDVDTKFPQCFMPDIWHGTFFTRTIASHDALTLFTHLHVTFCMIFTCLFFGFPMSN